MKKVFSIILTIAMLATMMSSVLASVSIPINDNVTITNEASSLVSKVLGAIQWVGYAIAMGMLLYIGIKYVMASANEKADLKKGAINYVIGVIVLVSVSTIFGFIKGIV